jgi:hypothetical protein
MRARWCSTPWPPTTVQTTGTCPRGVSSTSDDLLVWVLSIAHNAHLDQRRRDARLSVVDPERASADQDAQGGDPGVDVGLRIDLVHALARLSPEQREPLLLVSVEQLTYAECAEVLRIPVGTVMSRVSRATLRQYLDGSAKPAGGPLRSLRRWCEMTNAAERPDDTLLLGLARRRGRGR